MISDRDKLREGTINANIYVHAFLANAGEYEKSPHFRPENKKKIRAILHRLTAALADIPDKKAIDFGCGTGFMIDLMKDLFSEVHGVDITLDMMNKVDLTPGNIYLHECLAEKTSFPINYFDFATAYSFMDHLFDYKDFLKEVFRVLKPGGIFYTDLNPNRSFILAMYQIEKESITGISPLVEKEIKGALHNGEHYMNNFGLNGELLEKAEPIKSIDKGFDASEVINAGYDIGFTQCRVEFEWFLGQAKVMHEQSTKRADLINDYLASVLPVSSSLYKYLRFIFIK